MMRMVVRVDDNVIVYAIALIIICAAIIMLPFTINSYIIMQLNDFRNWCGF